MTTKATTPAAPGGNDARAEKKAVETAAARRARLAAGRAPEPRRKAHTTRKGGVEVIGSGAKGEG